jgi:hypothetical protein
MKKNALMLGSSMGASTCSTAPVGQVQEFPGLVGYVQACALFSEAMAAYTLVRDTYQSQGRHNEAFLAAQNKFEVAQAAIKSAAEMLRGAG